MPMEASDRRSTVNGPSSDGPFFCIDMRRNGEVSAGFGNVNGLLGIVRFGQHAARPNTVGEDRAACSGRHDAHWRRSPIEKW